MARDYTISSGKVLSLTGDEIGRQEEDGSITWFMQVNTPAGAERPDPVTASRSVTGRVRILRAGGADAIGEMRQLGVEVQDSDLFGFSRASSRRQLSLPGPYNQVGLEMVHPCVIDFPTGWMGYRYWMCATPYPGSNSNYENPCIFASNDKYVWEIPAGLTNPVAEKPSLANTYNADNFIFFRDGRLHLVYRERSPENQWNRLMLLWSDDGSAWSAPQEILRGVYGTQDFGSPSIWHDGSQWVLTSHNLDAGGYPVQRFTSASLLSGWSTASAVTVPHPTAATWWHSEFRRLPSGKVVGVIQDGNSGGGALFFAESLDGGVSFAVKKITPDSGYYKSGFTLGSDNSMSLFVGRIAGGFYIHAEDWGHCPAPAVARAAVSDFKDFGVATELILFDSFNRADSAVSIGSADAGPAYSVTTGTVGIASNRAYGVTTSNNRAVVSSGSANHYVQFRVSLYGNSNLWLIFRGVDANNYWRLGSNAGSGTTTLTLQSIVAGGVAESLVISGAQFKDGGVYGCRAVGSILSIYQDGVLMAEYQRTAHAAGVQCGFQTSGTVLSYLDNLIVAKQ